MCLLNEALIQNLEKQPLWFNFSAIAVDKILIKNQ